MREGAPDLLEKRGLFFIHTQFFRRKTAKTPIKQTPSYPFEAQDAPGNNKVSFLVPCIGTRPSPDYR
jgi:hypothetical protein